MRHRGRKFSFIGSKFFILCANQRAESAVSPWQKFQLMCKLTVCRLRDKRKNCAVSREILLRTLRKSPHSPITVDRALSESQSCPI
jgi:hypothetical protein